MTLDKLISNFELLGDWEERYGYLIDLGKKLEGLSDAEKNEDNRVHGCQAMVWMVLEPLLRRPHQRKPPRTQQNQLLKHQLPQLI